MSEFRGSIFRQQQTDFCASIAEPPQKGFDEHNPPGSMFREEQTLHIYGTFRFRRIEPQPNSEPTPSPTTPLPPHPAPHVEVVAQSQTEETTPEGVCTYQVSELLSLDLSHLNNRRLLLMASARLLDRAAQITDDGLNPKDLRFYSKNVVKAHAHFDRTIKPKSPLAFLREKLFDD